MVDYSHSPPNQRTYGVMVKLTEDQRRTIILVAATRVAKQSGMAAVTHGTVAKRCYIQTSKSTVENYFKTKDDLWRATLVFANNAEINESAKECGWVE